MTDTVLSGLARASLQVSVKAGEVRARSTNAPTSVYTAAIPVERRAAEAERSERLDGEALHSHPWSARFGAAARASDYCGPADADHRLSGPDRRKGRRPYRYSS